MTIPAAWTTALALPGVEVDLWLEIEGIAQAFGLTPRAAPWYAGRAATEQRTSILALMEGLPAGVEQRARPLDGDSSIGEMSVDLMDDAAGSVRALVAGVGRTDHRLYMMAPEREDSTAYSLNDVVTHYDGDGRRLVARCSTAGTSAVLEGSGVAFTDGAMPFREEPEYFDRYAVISGGFYSFDDAAALVAAAMTAAGGTYTGTQSGGVLTISSSDRTFRVRSSTISNALHIGYYQPVSNTKTGDAPMDSTTGPGAWTSDKAVGDTISDGTVTWTVIAISQDLGATGSETFIPYLGAADAAQYPLGGGTIYIGRETFTYTARTAGTNGAGYFSGVTRGMYALPGRSAKAAHDWGDVITPYVRFVATRRAQLLATIDGTDASRLARWGGTIKGVRALRGSAGYSFTMGSLDGELRVKAFGGQRTAKLFAGIQDGGGAYSGESGEPASEESRIRLVADSMAGTWTVGQTIMLRVGEEFFAGMVASDATGTYVDFSGAAGARSLFSTDAVQHPVGEDIAEVVWTGGYDASGTAEYRFSKFTQGDHPLEVLLCFLLSKRGDGANGAYDVLPEGWGLGLDAARVDVAGIERLARQWMCGQRHLWLYTEPFSFKEELSNLLRPHLCFPVVTLGDLLTIRRLSPPIPGQIVRAVASSAIVDVPTWDANIVDVVGRIIWRCDWDPLADESRQTFIGEMQGAGVEAQEFYAGQFQTLEIDAKGAFTGNDPAAAGFFGAALQTSAASAALRYFETIRDRYARPFPILGVDCSYDYLDVEAGDLVYLTLDAVPNPETGGVGLTSALCEVLTKQIDDRTARVQLTLMQTAAAAARLISPSLPVSNVAGATMTLLDAELYAIGYDAFAEAPFAVDDVVEVWTSDLLTSRGTATVTVVADSGTAGAVAVTVGSLPAGTTAGDVLCMASYDSETTNQRSRYASLADASGTLGSGDATAHLYAI